jgi:ketosteroid isomerase-like protein
MQRLWIERRRGIGGASARRMTGVRGAASGRTAMSTETENVARLKDAYRHWQDTKGHGTDCWLNLVDDTLSLRSLADGAPGMEFTASGQTRGDFVAYLQQLVADWEMIAYEMHEYIAQDDRVVAIGHCAWRHKRTGKAVDTPKVDIWRFKNGKVVEFFELYDTARTIAATQ